MTTAPSSFEAPFVRTDAAQLRGVAVVAPTADLARVVPVHGESHAIVERALEQFGIFAGRLRAHGVDVATLPGVPGAPLGTLCADGAIVFADGAFLMRPSDLNRRAEVPALEAALQAARIPIVGRIAAPGLLDGGDAILTESTLYLAVTNARRAEQGIRPFAHGNALGRAQLAEFARGKGLAVVEVPVAAGVVRLRSVASLIDERTLLVAAGLVDVAAFAGLETIVAPSGEDAGAGVLALGKRRVLANLRFRETIPLLRRAKFAVDAIDLWEFGKIGATPSSMALALKRG